MTTGEPSGQRFDFNKQRFKTLQGREQQKRKNTQTEGRGVGSSKISTRGKITR
jgi:hypothetical protein